MKSIYIEMKQFNLKSIFYLECCLNISFDLEISIIDYNLVLVKNIYFYGYYTVDNRFYG